VADRDPMGMWFKVGISLMLPVALSSITAVVAVRGEYIPSNTTNVIQLTNEVNKLPNYQSIIYLYCCQLFEVGELFTSIKYFFLHFSSLLHKLI
jgi:hypothetical protein